MSSSPVSEKLQPDDMVFDRVLPYLSLADLGTASSLSRTTRTRTLANTSLWRAAVKRTKLYFPFDKYVDSVGYKLCRSHASMRRTVGFEMEKQYHASQPTQRNIYREYMTASDFAEMIHLLQTDAYYNEFGALSEEQMNNPAFLNAVRSPDKRPILFKLQSMPTPALWLALKDYRIYITKIKVDVHVIATIIESYQGAGKVGLDTIVCDMAIVRLLCAARNIIKRIYVSYPDRFDWRVGSEIFHTLNDTFRDDSLCYNLAHDGIRTTQDEEFGRFELTFRDEDAM